ncbi:MAG: hypothetical protein ISR58_05150 [Anaerolineales bacterium]|nr:hypothetical protein [Anaerolineales bacterium]
MISFTVVFFMFMFFFALIGGLRGWAKELLVTFSVVLTLFLVFVLERYSANAVVPFSDLDAQLQGASIQVIEPQSVTPFDALDEGTQNNFQRQFWIRTVVLVTLVFFGFQTPSLTRLGGTARREKIQDFLLGLFIGGINGYFIIGTIWSYMHSAHYPFAPYIIAPNGNDPLIDTANALVNILPPVWLGTSPGIFLAIGVSFLFVLVVFI